MRREAAKAFINEEPLKNLEPQCNYISAPIW